ncbi:MAG TPA: transglutaminase-like domain-containing protein [Balneolaceae bacterium]|nr:transglutaminase-like domain-containing protein [Balneolaceae bacterium]
MSQKTEIESLVFLLNDPDPDVQGAVRERLFEMGQQAVPLLDEKRNTVNDEEERELINDIIRHITYGHVEEDFIDILEGGVKNIKQLEKAVLILSRFENPTLRVSDYERKLDRWAEDIEDEIRFQPDETKQMHVLLSYIFETLGFSGGTTDYYHPKNAYLDRVIDRRRGLPISLAFVVLFLARRLNLPFYGLNVPIHFMVKFSGLKEEVLIDPFDHGKSVTYNQCYYFLKQNGVEPKAVYFNKANEASMLARMIRNLVRSYHRRDEEQKAEHLQELLQTLEMMCL